MIKKNAKSKIIPNAEVVNRDKKEGLLRCLSTKVEISNSTASF